MATMLVHTDYATTKQEASNAASVVENTTAATATIRTAATRVNLVQRESKPFFFGFPMPSFSFPEYEGDEMSRNSKHTHTHILLITARDL